MSQNRARTGRRRQPPPTAFKPGRSGNPGGRPKRTQDERDLMTACRARTPKALDRITELMEHADKDSVSLNAAIFIVERGYGKPVQPTEDRSPLFDAATDVLLAMKAALEARKATRRETALV